MKGINELSINITKALITKVSIDLSNMEKPEYTVQGVLTTDQGRVVSDFMFWNGTFVSNEKKLDIPVNVHLHASEIFKALKPIIYDKLNDMYPQIPYITRDGQATEAEEIKEKPKQESESKQEENLDDIPF